MQLKHGNYSFGANRAAVTTDTAYVRSQTGRRLREVRGMTVKAFIQADTQAALQTEEEACRAALRKEYQDLLFLRNDGTATPGSLSNRTSISGVVIVDGPSFGESMTPEWVRVRTVRFRAEAQYVIPGTEDLVIEFRESEGRQGNGGPKRLWRTPIFGSSIRQETTEETMISYVVSGRAVRHTGGHYVPTPKYGTEFLVNEAEAVQYELPEPLGQGLVNYVTTWNYRYEVFGQFLIGQTRFPRM